MEESINKLSAAGPIREAFGLKAGQLETYSPLTLAYIGDAFYELVIRTYVIEGGDAGPKVNSRRASSLAQAVTQARISRALEDMSAANSNAAAGTERSDAEQGFLTKEELDVMRRGRNATTAHSAKHASMSEYRHATGFEALIGYLYLAGRDERAIEIIKAGWQAADAEDIWKKK